MLEVRAALYQSGVAAEETARLAQAASAQVASCRAHLGQMWAGTSRPEPAVCLGALDRAAAALGEAAQQAAAAKAAGDRYAATI